MSRVALAVLLGVGLIGFAPSRAEAASRSNRPQIEFQQITRFPEDLAFRGLAPVDFLMTVRNPSETPITLRRIDLESVGAGAFRVDADASWLNRVIPAGSTVQLRIATWGRVPFFLVRRAEPVTLRGIAYFQTPNGGEMSVVTQLLPQI